MKRIRGSRKVPATLAASLTLAGLAVLTAGSSVASVEIDRSFAGRTDVIEVQIPVNVVGRDGEPVRGLTAEDFEILDEGKKQDIRDFEVIDLEVLEPGETRTEIETAVPASARRHFLLLFDLSFSKPHSIMRAREAARQFVLNEVHETDLVAVGTHSVEQGAQLLVTFTPDRGQVARAIDTLGAPRLLNLARQDPLRFIIDNPDDIEAIASSELNDLTNESQTTGLQQSVVAHIRVIAKEMAKMERSFARGRVSSWSRSMAELAKYLDSVRGRKHVVYFSEGWDGRLLLGRNPDAQDAETQQDLQNLQTGNHFLVDTDDIYGNTGLQSQMDLMVEEFRRADCVIQAVDISGLRADRADEERVRSVGRDALFFVANETGGELFEDANDFTQELNTVLERSSVTYLLTFQPTDAAHDGRYHRLRIKVRGARGSRVSARKGYYAPRPYEELHPLEKGLLASDAIATASSSNDVPMQVLAAAFRASEEQAYVPVIVEVGGKDLVKGMEGGRLPVEFFAYATDERGEMKDFFTQMVSLDVSRQRATFESTGLKYYGHMDLAPGSYLLRVLVRNARTGRTGLQTVELEVPEYAEAEPILLPPFFLEDSGRWFLVREKQAEFQKSVVYPFTVNGEPYVPAALPAVAEGSGVQVCLVAYNFSNEQPQLDGEIVNPDGQIVAEQPFGVIERTVTGIDGLDKFLATFEPRGLSAGSYTLRVALTDRVSGVTQTNSIPFVLD